MSEKKLKLIERLTTLFLGASVVFVIWIMTQILSTGYVTINGYSMFRVVTGSMEPTISVNSLLVCDRVSIDEIQVDDIVCFESTNPMMLGEIVTHRVIAIDRVNDVIRLTTKGDANTVEDALYVTHNNLIGRVVWYSADKDLIAEMISFLSGSMGFLGCIVFPILMASTIMLRESIKSIKKELVYLKKIENEAKLIDQSIESEEEMIERLKKEIRKELGLSEE